MVTRKVIFIYMDALNTFKKYLNEEELPYFTDFDKSILKFILDNIENIEEGDDVNDVVSTTLDQDTNFSNYGDALRFIESFNGEYGRGWHEAIEYLYSLADEFGEEEKNVISGYFENGQWHKVADYILLGKARELLSSSEILAQKIANGDDVMTAEDIEDLEQELDFIYFMIKLKDLLNERKDFIVVLDNGNDFPVSFYDEGAARNRYPVGADVDGGEVVDITTPSGTSIMNAPARKAMSEVIDAFSDMTKKTLSAKSAESLKKMLGGKSAQEAMMSAMQLLPKVMEAEKPYRDQLEQLAKEVVSEIFPIIKDAGIEIDAKLVDSPNQMKISKGQDEEEVDTEEEANDALDGISDKSGVDKRRIINSITQGAGIRGTKAYYLFDYAMDTLDSLGVKDDYEQLVNDAYGIYDDDAAIAMMMAMLSQGGGQGSAQGGESEIDWNEEEDTMTIKATALTFPILMQELVKGLYEFVALQGFTDTAKGKGQAIVKATDKVTNEPEDIRWGKFIYDSLRDIASDADIDNELFFAEVYKLEQPFFQEFIEAAINDDLTTDHKRWVEDTIQRLESEEEESEEEES